MVVVVVVVVVGTLWFHVRLSVADKDSAFEEYVQYRGLLDDCRDGCGLGDGAGEARRVRLVSMAIAGR